LCGFVYDRFGKNPNKVWKGDEQDVKGKSLTEKEKKNE
jgi:hypothetical protein